jgi:hypothetical protein
VIVENASGRAIGSSRYYDWNPADESVVIGYTYLARASTARRWSPSAGCRARG